MGSRRRLATRVASRGGTLPGPALPPCALCRSWSPPCAASSAGSASDTASALLAAATPWRPLSRVPGWSGWGCGRRSCEARLAPFVRPAADDRHGHGQGHPASCRRSWPRWARAGAPTVPWLRSWPPHTDPGDTEPASSDSGICGASALPASADQRRASDSASSRSRRGEGGRHGPWPRRRAATNA